ncbi:MAG: hypothetical protein JWL81_1665 [Verrucomicrobiales bacterium]|nr:hypothetical protein [Verrucomicrobiales bacterium]
MTCNSGTVTGSPTLLPPFPAMSPARLLKLFTLSTSCSLLLACGAPAAPAVPASGWTISRNPAAWKMQGFEGNLDLSGIASIDGKTVLVGSDELIAAQPGTLDKANHAITAGALIPLMANPSGKKMEIDIEGVAAAPAENCYYVTGSHGVGKKKGEFEESRASVFKVPCDPATGAPLTEGIQRASLMPWLEQNATFRDYAKKPLQLNGFNIEGLTWHEGKLFFGVRGPNVQGKTFVIETTPATLFGGGLPDAKIHELPVGEARGIREIAAVRDGFIVITGNASAEATKKFPTSQTRMADKVFDVFLWRPGKEPEVSSIGVLPRPMEKAEAVLILEDAPAYVDLLVVFDGATDGGPQSYRLTRP